MIVGLIGHSNFRFQYLTSAAQYVYFSIILYDCIHKDVYLPIVESAAYVVFLVALAWLLILVNLKWSVFSQCSSD